MKNCNRHLLRRVGALLMTAALMLSITACGKSFDAAGYLEATMKAIATGDGSALNAYTDESTTDFKEEYAEQIEDTLESMTKDANLSDDVKQEYKELIMTLMGKISYSVGEAKELTEGSASGYAVPLTIKPLQLKIKDKFNKWVNNLDVDENTMSDMDAFYKTVYQEMAKLLKEAIAEGEYGKEVTYTIHITENGDGEYEINEDDMEKVLTNMFTIDMDGVTQ